MLIEDLSSTALGKSAEMGDALPRMVFNAEPFSPSITK